MTASIIKGLSDLNITEFSPVLFIYIIYKKLQIFLIILV